MTRPFEVQVGGDVLRGLLHNAEAPRCSAVIIHGYFSSHRVGPARLYVRLGRALARAGCEVYRADAIGVGDSDGEFANVSLDSEVRDFVAVCQYARSISPRLPLVLIGHSMGANLAVRVAGMVEGVCRLVLIAPEVRFRRGVDSLFDDTQRSELKERGWTLRKGLVINQTFVDELRREAVLDRIADVHVPVTVVQGTADELYALEGAEALAARARCGRMICVEDADHNFLAPQWQEALIRVVLHDVCDGA